MSEKPISITQSLLKSLIDYKEGDECGLVFEKKFIENRFDLFPPSEVQNIGTWFEYETTKAIPKNGKIPEPEKTQKGELTAPYKKMQAHIANFKMFMSVYQIKIISAGVDVEVDGMKGTYDLICEAGIDIHDADGVLRIKAGQRFIIDIKTTGLLDDKWSDYGWNLETLNKKHRIILQPIHYKFLSELKFGERYPFLFLLFSNTNEVDFRAIFFDISDEDIEYHKEFIIKSVKWLEYYMRTGFKAHPEVSKCAKCPLKTGCKHFAAVPKIQYYLLTNPNA